MKKGFTLIELLGVIVLLSLIFIIALPKIINSTNDDSNSSELKEDLIYKAAQLYIKENTEDNYEYANGDTYCISLRKLVNQKYLKSPVILNGDYDVTDLKSVEVTYKNGLNYSIKNNNECKTTFSKYQNVDYIESNGTQIIDLMYMPKTTTKIEVELSFDGTFSNTSPTAFIGVYDGDNVFTVNFGGASYQENILYPWVDKSNASGATSYMINITNEIRNNRNLLTLQSGLFEYSTVSKTIATKTENMTKSLCVFGRNYNDEYQPFGAYKMKVYTLKIYEGNDLIRNLIPCYREYDDEPGLYDTINKIFYPNIRTGRFRVGNKI